ncbi:hypothetical protein BCR42DRAFT_439889 [Absidia repens]|uniref:Uncharacterized protein n=1 Tax=Absidia repens TaxID=90262 RepID=A0A1X2IAI3_9FUNG|nr:hypothetical protein BCR42DRAFT_439889 [Absidia repens]
MDVNATTPSEHSSANYVEHHLWDVDRQLLGRTTRISTAVNVTSMDVAVDEQTHKMILVALNNADGNGGDNGNGSITTGADDLSSYRLSGLAYLDTDVINSTINHCTSSGPTSSKSAKLAVIGGVTTLSAAVLLVLIL